MLFERYNRHEQLRAELPDLQLRYLRPPGLTAPQQPRTLVGAVCSGWCGPRARLGIARFCAAVTIGARCRSWCTTGTCRWTLLTF